MTTSTASETRPSTTEAGQQWHGWGSPVGLGLGLLTIGGFFAVLAEGLAILASIG